MRLSLTLLLLASACVAEPEVIGAHADLDATADTCDHFERICLDGIVAFCNGHRWFTSMVSCDDPDAGL
jgi:hypothetical protein